MRDEISGFLPQIQFEVTRRDFNSAARQCEMHLSSRLDKDIQVVDLLELRWRCDSVDRYSANLPALLA